MKPGRLLARLPEVRGKYRAQADLSKINWFNVGGPAEVLFRPADIDDLTYFLLHKPQDVPVTVIGVGSNLLVRDGGIKGVVIRLGQGFTHVVVEGNSIRAGAGALSRNVAAVAQQAGIAELEFMVGIPGTVGGALAMNAGAYGSDISQIFIGARAVDRKGAAHALTAKDMRFSYRHSGVDPSWIFIEGIFKGKPGNSQQILENMQRIMEERERTQPIRTRTGGSTFTNPPGKKAWELIDAAGCRGLETGKAKVSEKHCNFLMNAGGATSEDLEKLGEEIRKRVKEHSGITLEWEIKRVGEK